MLETTFSNGLVEMEADDEYQQQLALFVRSSDDKAKALAQLEPLVARLSRRERFLDVGAGGGDLTGPLSRLFAQTTVVEPNRLQAERLSAAYPQCRVWNCRFEDLDVGPEAFDLVLCSHVLYYVRETGWLALVQKMHDLLNPGGKAVIILQSPAGEMGRFFRHFTGRDVPVVPLWDDLVARFGSEAVDARYVRVEIRARTLEEMTSLGLFLLLDRRFRQRAGQIRAYFADHHRANPGYLLHQGQILLVVTRPRTDRRA